MMNEEEVDLRNLKVLQNVQIDKLLDNICKHTIKFNKTRQCECKESFCNHLLKERQKRFGRRINEQYNKMLNLGFKAFKGEK